ncbi:MAG TPA: hypothetical protein VKE50_04750, partial [Thermoanaerobaculia bacterium]|nr:hypothetical protein [Thermoanaerobaculia bacterium]
GAGSLAAAVLFFAAAASAFAALGVLDDLQRGDRFEIPLRVLVGLLPLTVLLACLWAFFPALQAAISPRNGRLAAAAVLVVLSSAVWIMAVPARRESRRRELEVYQRFEEGRREDARRIAEMDALPADAPMSDYLAYTQVTSERESDVPAAAIGRMSKLPNRQAEAEELLEKGDLRVFEALDRLELAATPRLCAGARLCLRREAETLRPSATAPTFDAAERRVNEAMRSVPWLVKSGCDTRPEIGEVAAAVRLYPDSYPRKWFLDYAERLQSEKP